MIKAAAQIKAIVGVKEYLFYLDNDSPPADAKEALFQFIKAIGQIEDNLKAQMEAAKAEEKAKSECVEKKCEPIEPE
jgi:hypothetical protein